MVHIADSPCHGAQYHDGSDNYKAGDPAGITHEQMMGKIAEYGIQYWFGYIDYDSTSKMINVFNESLQKISGKRLLIRQIKATNPKEVEDAASRYVTNCAFMHLCACVSVCLCVSACVCMYAHVHVCVCVCI